MRVIPPRSSSCSADHNVHPGACCFSGREYIGDIISNLATFNVNKVRINAADAECFPLLSRIASVFEYYRFTDLQFTINPSSPSTTGGKVMLRVEPDIFRSDPTNKQEMVTSDCSISALPCETPGWLKVPPSILKARPWWFCRETVPTVVDDDQRLDDVGRLFWACQGLNLVTGTEVAEVWVQYTAEFHSPSITGPSLPDEVLVTSTGSQLTTIGGAYTFANNTSTVANTSGMLVPRTYMPDSRLALVSDGPSELHYEGYVEGIGISDAYLSSISNVVVPLTVGNGITVDNIHLVINAAQTAAFVRARITSLEKLLNIRLSQPTAWILAVAATAVGLISQRLTHTASGVIPTPSILPPLLPNPEPPAPVPEPLAPTPCPDNVPDHWRLTPEGDDVPDPSPLWPSSEVVEQVSSPPMYSFEQLSAVLNTLRRK